VFAVKRGSNHGKTKKQDKMQIRKTQEPRQNPRWQLAVLQEKEVRGYSFG